MKTQRKQKLEKMNLQIPRFTVKLISKKKVKKRLGSTAIGKISFFLNSTAVKFLETKGNSVILSVNYAKDKLGEKVTNEGKYDNKKDLFYMFEAFSDKTLYLPKL